MKNKDSLNQIVTVNIPFNQKQKSSAAHRHFEKYDRQNPISVAESLARGVRPIDIRYDLNWGFISLTAPDKKPLDIQEEMKRCGLNDAEYVIVYRHPQTGT